MCIRDRFGADGAEKVRGLEPNIVFWNQVERATEADYNDLSARLRGGSYTNPFTGEPNTLFLSDCNPQGPNHFMLKRAKTKLTHMYPTQLEDNIGYFCDGEWTEEGAAYRRRLDLSYPHEGYQRDRMVHGKWSGAEGLIYPNFSELKHVRAFGKADIPSGWKWQGAVDYGINHPAAYGLWVVSPNRKRTWLFKLIQKTGLTASDLVPEIKALNAKYGVPRRVRIVGDYASDHNETLRRAGLNVIDAEKEVLFGIDVVRQWFAGTEERELLINANALAHPPDPVLVNASKPTTLVEELYEYAHLPEDKQTTGTEKDDMPDKRAGGDDACDMMRYHIVDVTKKKSGYVPVVGTSSIPSKLPMSWQ